MDNMGIWNEVCQPPKHALKQIGGGRLKGMTDINPQWRYQVMTQTFGPCGLGWKYEITKLWTEQGSHDQVLAFATINLYISRSESLWSEPIPGIGGSSMVVKESGGLYSSDECYKMAVTDALSVAMKQLGVAADIYAGLWDGSKYREIKQDHPLQPKESAKTVAAATFDTFSKEEQDHIKNLASDIVASFESSDQEGFNAYEGVKSTLDADKQVALWGCFSKEIKNRIKQIGAKNG